MALSECTNRINSQGRELVDHGTALFPVACYHDDLGTMDVPWHWHDELEVVVVTEGKTTVAAGADKYVVKQGEGFFVNAGILHAAWDMENSGCRFHSIVFHPRLVGGGIDSVFWQSYIQPLIGNHLLPSLWFDGSEAWHQDILDAIEEAWQNCVKEGAGYEFRVRAALSQAVFLLSGYHPIISNQPSAKALRDGERMKTMLHYISEHYREELNTALIAKSVMISESECLRCFRSTIGTPPIQYVRQFRIQKASELLTSTEQKITDIAIQSGFQDMSYFTKTFRELKGCTPSEYRSNQ